MRKNLSTFPLGIDVGAARTRVALLERRTDGSAQVAAVAARPTGVDPGRAIAEAWRELGTRERRCILALDAADASLHVATLPAMPRSERRRAARFEAARVCDFPVTEADVCLVPYERGRWVVGVVRKSARNAKAAAAKQAGLHVVGIDDAAFALLRALPTADAIVDFGDRGTRVVVPLRPLPAVRRIPLGGRNLTTAVAASLGLSEGDAEARKLRIGLAGAGEHLRDELIAALARTLEDTRANGSALHQIVMTGNGARLPTLAEALGRSVAVPVRDARLGIAASTALPPDVVRAASLDWSLAVGLALWDNAG